MCGDEPAKSSSVVKRNHMRRTEWTMGFFDDIQATDSSVNHMYPKEEPAATDQLPQYVLWPIITSSSYKLFAYACG